MPKQVGIDIQTLSRDQSAMFQRRLASAGVRFTMRGTTVRVALGDADDARDLLAELALPDPAEEGQHYDVNPFQRESIEGVGVPAARMRRWVGAVIDGFVFGVLAIGLEAAGVRPSVTLGLAGAITVVMVTLIGATPGKLAVGTRVCDIRTWRTPSLWASAVRWVTPLAAGLLIPIVPWGVQLMFLGYLANVILILFAADGRGLHDLAAGTIVISPSRGVDRRRRR